MAWPWHIHLILACGLFAVGAVVGSFLNVCIYRIPWQKSVIWPDSRCPRCLTSIEARDNIPILSWLWLRGACRGCGLPIAPRYPAVELLVGLLFAGVYIVDVYFGPRTMWGDIAPSRAIVVFYHAALIALLVVATFIDYDLMMIPDAVTVPGMILGLAVGAVVPDVRPEPSAASTHWQGFVVGIVGLVVGGGLTWSVRFLGSAALRREAMGFGDVTLMAMIGAFLGWQAAVLAFFLAPFFGLSHAAVRMLSYWGKRLAGAPLSASDREIPFGPYLSMAAVALVLSWPWFWKNFAKPRFEILGVVSCTETERADGPRAGGGKEFAWLSPTSDAGRPSS